MLSYHPTAAPPPPPPAHVIAKHPRNSDVKPFKPIRLFEKQIMLNTDSVQNTHSNSFTDNTLHT